MENQLSVKNLYQILQNEDISRLTYAQLVDLFEQELATTKSAMAKSLRVDPRNGDKIIFNPARATRPRDNMPPSTGTGSSSLHSCVICQGNTTGVVDFHPLSEGFTFINKNLFPMVRPTNTSTDNAHGLHFLQWTSSHHDADWHNLPHTDQVIAMQRLVALERCLLTTADERMPEQSRWGGLPGQRGFVSIIKNGGHLVGGSLAHGHQQIAYTNIAPRRIAEDWHFMQEKGEAFTEFLLRENNPQLTVADLGEAVLLIPYFMQRPYNMMLLVKDVQKRHLYQLNRKEIEAIAQGWHLAISSIFKLLPQLGREIAYNAITHNGPCPGIYFEFLPYTQEMGGFEHLGLTVCHADPEVAATKLRELIAR